MATADNGGVKQGSTKTYHPYGQALAGLPDNSAGNFDYGWLGLAAEYAKRLSTRLEAELGWSPRQRGAFRHALWMALTTLYTADPRFARGLGRAHERDVPGTDEDGRRDSVADLYNNDIGILVGIASAGFLLVGGNSTAFIVNTLVWMTSNDCSRMCLNITDVRG